MTKRIVRMRWGQTWDSGLLGHLLHGKLAFVGMKRHLRIGLVRCRPFVVHPVLPWVQV